MNRKESLQKVSKQLSQSLDVLNAREELFRSAGHDTRNVCSEIIKTCRELGRLAERMKQEIDRENHNGDD